MKRQKVVMGKQRECLYRSRPPRGSLEKVLWKVLPNSQETSVLVSLFYKVELCRSATLSKISFLVTFAKFLRISFLKNTTGQLFLIIAVSILVKRKLTNRAVNYDTKTKPYVLIWSRSVSFQRRQSWWKNRFQKQSFEDVL